MPYLPWQQNVQKIHRARPRSLRGHQLTSITNDFLGMWVDDVTSLSELSTICRENSETNESRNLILYILKMKFFSYDYEILFSSLYITQGTIIRKIKKLVLAARLRLDLPQPLHNNPLHVYIRSTHHYPFCDMS